MSSTKAARLARTRAGRAGLRLRQRQRGAVFDLVDADGEIVHTGDVDATNKYLVTIAQHRTPGPPVAAAPPAWRPALDILCRELRGARHSPGTVRVRVQNLTTFARRHPGSDPLTVSREDLAGYLSNSAFSPSYAHSLRATFRVFFRILRENGLRADDPAERLAGVRIPRSLPRPCPDGAIAHAIATATDPRVRLALRIAAETGLRRAEIARLKRADVEGWPGSYSLRVIGKGGHERVVPLSDELAVDLRGGETVHVFTSSRGGPISPTYLGNLIAGALPDHWTAHTLRHRFGSKAYQHSRDIRAVQELLGHSSVATTAIYTAFDDRSRRSAAEAARVALPEAPL